MSRATAGTVEVPTGQVSHWMVAQSGPRPSRDRLAGTVHADVAIVGAGLTGLWAARHLLRHRPSCRVVLVEAEHVGFGASGRNGGWLSQLVPGNRTVYARGPMGREGVRRLQRAFVDGIDDIVEDLDRLAIDADVARAGNLVLATTPAALRRLRSRRSDDLSWGMRPEEVVELSGADVAERIWVAPAIGGLFYPSVVALDPGKLVVGLARAVEELGATILEGTRATGVHPGRVECESGVVVADNVLICTEGYGGPLVGDRRVIPVNSSMIVTEPLPQRTWDELGWSRRECLSDAAHTFVYAQRTADGRIAIGGRGRPYRYGSGTGGDGATAAATVRELSDRLTSFFPGVDLPVDRSWSGVLGVTRDWCAGIHHNRTTGVGAAFGYAGHGVTSAALAGATLADLTLGVDSPLVHLPWVGHRSPDWEPDPVRWLGVHAMYALFRGADRWEEWRGATRTSLAARLGARLTGLE